MQFRKTVILVEQSGSKRLHGDTALQIAQHCSCSLVQNRPPDAAQRIPLNPQLSQLLAQQPKLGRQAADVVVCEIELFQCCQLGNILTHLHRCQHQLQPLAHLHAPHAQPEPQLYVRGSQYARSRTCKM